MTPLLALSLVALSLWGSNLAAGSKYGLKKPNVVLLMSDDQDLKLGSLDGMQVLQKELVAKGTSFTNHFATVSNCCPSRASLLRGQAAHNNNVTHVRPPGGNYDKWVVAGEDKDYLPMWIKKAGYRAEYVGKFLNGYNTVNWHIKPKGWDHVDALLDPYIANYNNPVMSLNGERPVSYHGFHQTDVVRTKALARLDYLTSQDQPWYLTIAPYAPHVQGTSPPVPCARHNETFSGAKAPRLPWWNPDDDIQRQKSVWMKDIPQMNDTEIAGSDRNYRARLQALQGVDEIIEDVLQMLEEKGQLENTYFIYTTDNGYHVGNHRLPSGKALPYVSDSNLPMIVRGPGVPAGVVSNLPGAHLDFAPTFLNIMGLPREQWPPFLDGRSLLDDWHNPTQPLDGDAKEIINIEFWGDKIVEAPYRYTTFTNNSYKTLRIVTEKQGWLLIKWCTNEIEMYNTTADPYEIHNLARALTPALTKVLSRLNALLLVTKSCYEDSCRNPWSVLQPPSAKSTVKSIDDAMDRAYDDFYAGFPEVYFNECMMYQDEDNEQPFYPPGIEVWGLGKKYRNPTDNYYTTVPNGTAVPPNEKEEGGWEQRHVTLEEILSKSRELTDAELGFGDEEGDEHGGGPAMVD